MTAQTLDRAISCGASRHPERLAIKSLRHGEEITYGRLNLLVDALCAKYQGLLRKGHRCGVLLDDSIACHAVIHAGFRLGLCVVPLDAELGDRTLRQIASHAGLHVLFVSDKNMRPGHAKELAGIHVETFASALDAYGAALEQVQPFESRAGASDVAMLAFTSGSTSDPKAVVLTHENLALAYAAGVQQLGAPKVVGCVFRIATLGTLGIHFFFPQACGATTVVLPRLEAINAGRFWELHAGHGIDFFYLVPSLVKLMNHLTRPPAIPPRGIAVSAGAPLPVREQDEFHKRFGLPLRNIYGLTESSFAVFFGRVVHGRGTNDIGHARGVEIRVVDEQGRAVRPGEVGELLYRGGMVSGGYFDNPEATSKTFQQGWLATGDLVRQDPEGWIAVVGRKKDVIIRGGFNIHPGEVEEAILCQPGVIGAAVFGLDDDVKGEEVCAYVRIPAEAGFDEQGFVARVRKHLGSHRSPDRYHFSGDELPMNSAGKVMKRNLHHLFRAGR